MLINYGSKTVHLLNQSSVWYRSECDERISWRLTITKMMVATSQSLQVFATFSPHSKDGKKMCPKRFELKVQFGKGLNEQNKIENHRLNRMKIDLRGESINLFADDNGQCDIPLYFLTFTMLKVQIMVHRSNKLCVMTHQLFFLLECSAVECLRCRE